MLPDQTLVLRDRHSEPRAASGIAVWRYDVIMPRAYDRRLRAAERETMVQAQLLRRGITSPRVLDAMGQVPRELFVPEAMSGKAYEDSALPIECDQTISQPYIVARMTELLELTPDDAVLEVGTGSGYQTAILARLCARVYTIEWHLKLMTPAAERLRWLGLDNVVFRCADGSLGWPERAPFEGIIVTAGAPEVPEPLRGQLAEGGRLVVPVGPKDDQILVQVRRSASGFQRDNLFRCRFVKLRGAAGWRD